MHELALCRAIVETINVHADGRAITTVHLRVGHLRQVVPATLEFCWQATVEGTQLSGSELSIAHVPASVVCKECTSVSTLLDPILRCLTCGGAEVELVTGEEFMIDSIDLAPVNEPAEVP